MYDKLSMEKNVKGCGRGLFKESIQAFSFVSEENQVKPLSA